MDERLDPIVVSSQLGRAPRSPWRVGSRCSFGFPTTIVSPSLLADSTPFPTFAWLTCPWLSDRAAREESAGATDLWASRAAADPALSAALAAADEDLRRLRAVESGGTDECAAVGIAGQRDPLGVKCLHAHVALALTGTEDPIGRTLLESWPRECDDRRCREWADGAMEEAL